MTIKGSTRTYAGLNKRHQGRIVTPTTEPRRVGRRGLRHVQGLHDVSLLAQRSPDVLRQENQVVRVKRAGLKFRNKVHIETARIL